MTSQLIGLERTSSPLHRLWFDLIAFVLVAAVCGSLLFGAEQTLGPTWLDRLAGSLPQLRSTWTDAFMTTITRVGEELTLAAAFAVAALWSRRARGAHWGRFFVWVGGGGLMLDNLIKPLVGRARPAFDQLVPGTGSSFPSGHVIGTTALLMALAYYLSEGRPTGIARLVWTLAAAGAVAMAVSRVYLGVHWPTDTLAGLWVGGLWTWRRYAVMVSDPAPYPELTARGSRPREPDPQLL